MEDNTPYDDVTEDKSTDEVSEDTTEVDERDQRIAQLVADIASLNEQLVTERALAEELAKRNAELLLEIPATPEEDEDEGDDETPSSIDELFYGKNED